jgi:small subunit ribosomal protein S4
LKVGDVVAVRDKSKSLDRFKEVLDVTSGRPIPDWLTRETEAMRGIIASLPTREHITIPVKETFIVELYSK